MVCPNCQSNDIVELQNQHFCINCGRLIQLTDKKRGAGRPKADRLDKPQPLTIQIAGKAVASSMDKPKETILESSNEEPEIAVSTEDSRVDDTTAEAEETTDIPEQSSLPTISHKFGNNVSTPAPIIKLSSQAPALPEKVAKIAEVKARKRLQDIVPASPVVEIDSTVEEQPKIKSKRLPLSGIINAAWSEPWQGGPARILLLSAVIASVIAGGLSAISILSPEVLKNVATLAGVSSVLLSIALLFGVANTERASFALRRYDHRPIPRSWLFGGALAVLGRQTGVLMAGIIDLFLVLALASAAGINIPELLDQPYNGVVLLASYFVLALLLLAIWVKTGLAAAAVELGRMTVLSSLKFGWRSMWHHPELLGTRLVAALWLAASLTGVIAIGYVTHLYLPQYDTATIIATSSVLAFTAVLLGNFGAVGWRQACYRELVIQDQPEDAISMLSGHHNGSPSMTAKIAYVSVITFLLLGGIAAVFSSF